VNTGSDTTGTSGAGAGTAGLLVRVAGLGPDVWWWVGRGLIWGGWGALCVSLLQVVTAGLTWWAWGWGFAALAIGVGAVGARGIAHYACRREFSGNDDDTDDDGGGG
jgi:hypothetical protein